MPIVLQPVTLALPKIIPVRSQRQGPESTSSYVSRADDRAFRGLDRAVNERQGVRSNTRAMRDIVNRIAVSVGAYSASRQSPNFGVQRIYEEQERVTSPPGKIIDVYEASKRKQQLDIARFEQIKAKEQQSIDRINQLYENNRSIVQKAYEKTESMYEDQKRKIQRIVEA